ncbi:MAG: DUF393 domain-containing protein [Chitinophagaceae bacterium]|nr:MAG: DUF393 domain-containing protein [Chitinophagaceae bacterium]
MKTLKEHIILYDAVCPLCRLYTGAFVKGRFLDEQGRAPYQELRADSCPGLDRARAVNEIALVDRRSGTITYGVDSLFKILSHRWPALRPLFRCGPFAWLVQKLYSLVSYNRRVIMPAAGEGAGTPPSFHRGWRAAWMATCWLLTSIILQNYSARLEGVIPGGAPWREWAVCGGQLLWQGALACVVARTKTWEYLGTMMTVSLAGAIGLALLAALQDILGLADPVIAAGCFCTVAGLILAEHQRRCRILELPGTMTAGWILYRATILYFILN